MVLPGFGLAFLWKTFRKNENVKKWELNRQELTLPILVFAGIGLLFLTEKLAYRGADWAEFQRFQNARSEVYDYAGVPTYEANPEFFGGEEHQAVRKYGLCAITPCTLWTAWDAGLRKA